MPLYDETNVSEYWLNPFLRVRTSGFSPAATKYGNTRIADRFGMRIHHEETPVTVELVRLPTGTLRKLSKQKSHCPQDSGGFRYDVEDSSLIYGKSSLAFDRYCQIGIHGNHIRILFNQQYAAYTRLRVTKLPHPTKLAATLANVALIKRGILTLHGAAIQSSRRSFVLLGLSDTGKTFSAIQLCQKKGWQLLADDIFIVDENGTVFPNPFTTNLEHLNPVRHKLFGGLLKDGNERWGTLERYPTVAVGYPAPVENIYILEKRGWGHGIHDITVQQGADRIMAQNAMEFDYLSDPFLQRLAYFQRWNGIELYQTAYDIALAFSRRAKEVHEVVANDTGSLVTALQARLADTVNPPTILDINRSNIAASS